MSDKLVKLEFTYINFEGDKKSLALEYLEREIVDASEYLKTQLSGGFVKSDAFRYDLTCLAYPISATCIKFVFDYAIKYSVEQKRLVKECEDAKIIESNTCERTPSRIKTATKKKPTKKVATTKRDPTLNNIFVREITTSRAISKDKLKSVEDKFEFILTNSNKTGVDTITHNFEDEFIEKIGISYLFSVLQVSNYFMFNQITKLVTKSIENFRRYFIKIANANHYIESNISYMTLNIKKYANINVEIDSILDELVDYKKIVMTKEFADEILYTFLSFQMANKLEAFDDIVKEIKNHKLTSGVLTFKYFDIYHDSCVFDVRDSIGRVKLYDNYLFLQKVKNIITVKNEELRLFHYYDMMYYEEHQFETLNKQNYAKKHMIVTQKEFDIKFRKLTDNLFENFDWTNVVIAGGFIYGLLDNAYDSIVDSTDIDLFVYGNNEQIRNKIAYINKYFSKHNPFYAINKSVITIIIKSFRFDIQIVPVNKMTPFDIIDQFDFSYVMLYYNGIDVFTNIAGLVSIKYKVAIRINKKIDINHRGNKAIKKGLELVDQNMEDFDIGASFNIFAKSKIIRKVIPVLETNEIIETIKLYYSVKKVSTDVIELDSELEFNIADYVSESANVCVPGYTLVKQRCNTENMKLCHLMFNHNRMTFCTDYCEISRLNSKYLVIFLGTQKTLELFDIRDRVIEQLEPLRRKIPLHIFQSNHFFDSDEDYCEDKGTKNDYLNEYNHNINYHLKVYLNKKTKDDKYVSSIKSSSQVNLTCNTIVWEKDGRRGIKFYMSAINVKEHK